MDAKRLYDDLADELCEQPGVEPSTMMGYPCLRYDSVFFASWDPTAHRLIVKVPADRVDTLISERTACSFAPNGRRFREWAAIPQPNEQTWRTLLHEALEFAKE